MRRSMQEVNTQRRVFLLAFSLKLVAAPYVLALPENITYNCERFAPRSHFKISLSLIVRVNVVLNRTVVVDSD